MSVNIENKIIKDTSVMCTKQILVVISVIRGSHGRIAVKLNVYPPQNNVTL